jgi:hypothetical protein
MDKKIAGLLGAAAALTAVTGGNAAAIAATAPTQSLQASSYADLLTPVPNALAQLNADDAARVSKPSGEKLEMAQIQVKIGHHHHRYRHPKRRHRHHHHHHSYLAIPQADV